MRLALLLLAISSAAARSQTPAESLLQQVSRTALQTRTLAGSLTLSRQSTGQPLLTTHVTFSLAKPNLATLTLTGDDPEPPRALTSDGHDLYTLTTPTLYTRTAADTHGASVIAPWWAMPLRFFFTQSLNPFDSTPDPSGKLSLEPSQTIAGRSCRVLLVQGSQPMGYQARFFIAPNNQIARSVITFGPNVTFTAELTSLNPHGARSAFRFTPPPSATLKQGSPTDDMLPLGDIVPSFTLLSSTGQQVTLAREIKSHKATLINFWFLDCPPCLLELPDFERLYTALAPKGLQVLAIDKEDAPAGVNQRANPRSPYLPLAHGWGANSEEYLRAVPRL